MTGRHIAVVLAAFMMAQPGSVFGASHREAPITALDRAADIADFFAFVSYDDPTKVTFILDVDPLLDASNGPNYFPFDSGIRYAINIDNNQSALAEISFEFQFAAPSGGLPRYYTGFLGALNGIDAPADSPSPVPPGTPIIPPAITALNGAGSTGLNLSQTYTVTMVVNGKRTVLTNQNGGNFYAVPANVGPRTMPNYAALAAQGIYTTNNGIQVFAGTADDPFYIDLGAVFDTFNLRSGGFPSGVPGVLTPAQDADDTQNFSPDNVAGYNVNVIAIQVPITMLTSTGQLEPPTSPAATIGSWGTTSRPAITIRKSPAPISYEGTYQQVQRMGNPLINEVIIGTGFKDFWSMSQPVNDSQFASFDLDPELARVLNAAYEALFGAGAFPIPPPPRTDLLPLVTYAPPIAASGTPAGPVADLLRLNTGVPPTAQASRSRLGLLGGDPAGYPNGRRISDDVTDISLRAVQGILADSTKYNLLLGDGVNVNDVPLQETFPYVGWAQSGYSAQHVNPGGPGCTGDTGGICPSN
jgi:hypothetical protein